MYRTNGLFYAGTSILRLLKHTNETNLPTHTHTAPPAHHFLWFFLCCNKFDVSYHCILISYLATKIIYSRLVCISYEVYFIRIHGSSCVFFFFFFLENGPPLSAFCTATVKKASKKSSKRARNGGGSSNIVLQNHRSAQTNLAEWQILSMGQYTRLYEILTLRPYSHSHNRRHITLLQPTDHAL